VNSRSVMLRRRSGTTLAMLAFVSVGCGEEAPVETEPLVRPVKIVTVGGGVGSSFEYPGEVAPALQANLAFEVGGRMIEFPVQEGQFVRKGDLLGRLDPRDFEAQRDAEVANRNAAQSEFERFKSLLEKNAVAERDFEAAERQLEVSEAVLKIAEKALDDTNLRAPFAGRIARKLVEEFQAVQAKEPVVVLQDVTTLEMVIAVPEQDISRSRGGEDPALEVARYAPRVVVSAFPDRVFPAHLVEIATAADPVTRTFPATFSFDPPDDVRILPGMTAKIIVDRAAEDEGAALSVPAVATLADDTGEAYVWVLDESTMTVSRRSVQLGELSGSQVLITDGLSPGDQIASSGVHHLRDGMKVRRLGG